jgi:uncharacterized repeat protein (TIGR03803 family)
VKTLFRAAMLCALAVSSRAQTVSTIHTFNVTNGKYPQVVVLTQGRDGRLYGTTGLGGANGLGTIFKQGTAEGGNVVLYNFSGPDGSGPAGGLTLGTDGNYYGTASGGGANGFGVVFKITSPGVLTVLYNFTGGADGGYPTAPPIQASDGNYYGTTEGGSTEAATFYKMTPSGALSTIYTSSASNGWLVQSALLQGIDGSLYATAMLGGAFSCGAILKVTTTGALQARYSFPCGARGTSPIGTLTQDSSGNLYGTTLNGGTHNNAGTIFKIDSSLQSVTKLYDFGAFPGDGYGGYTGLALGTDGNLYGGTSTGGRAGAGSLYKIATSGTYTQLYSFPHLVGTNAQEPIAAPTQGTSGNFYGVTLFGGIDGDGSVYSLNVGLNPFVAFVKARGKIGSPAQILGQGLTGTTSVTFNGVTATSFSVLNDTYMTAVVPSGATTGPVVVTTPGGALTSNVSFTILQ